MQITDVMTKLNKDLSTLPLLINLGKLGKKAENLAKNSLRYLEKDSSEYLKKLDWVILNPWTFASSNFRNIDPKMKMIYDGATVIVPEGLRFNLLKLFLYVNFCIKIFAQIYEH